MDSEKVYHCVEECSLKGTQMTTSAVLLPVSATVDPNRNHVPPNHSPVLDSVTMDIPLPSRHHVRQKEGENGQSKYQRSDQGFWRLPCTICIGVLINPVFGLAAFMAFLKEKSKRSRKENWHRVGIGLMIAGIITSLSFWFSLFFINYYKVVSAPSSGRFQATSGAMASVSQTFTSPNHQEMTLVSKKQFVVQADQQLMSDKPFIPRTDGSVILDIKEKSTPVFDIDTASVNLEGQERVTNEYSGSRTGGQTTRNPKNLQETLNEQNVRELNPQSLSGSTVELSSPPHHTSTVLSKTSTTHITTTTESVLTTVPSSVSRFNIQTFLNLKPKQQLSYVMNTYEHAENVMGIKVGFKPFPFQ